VGPVVRGVPPSPVGVAGSAGVLAPEPEEEEDGEAGGRAVVGRESDAGPAEPRTHDSSSNSTGCCNLVTSQIATVPNVSAVAK